MYYLYRHIRLDKEIPFYIGIGTIYKGKSDGQIFKRAYSKSNRNNYWKNIVKKHGYYVEILFKSTNKSLILQKEVEFIDLYKMASEGGILCNMTSGGEENFHRTEEQKRYGKYNPASQPVLQYNLNGEFIDKFDSITEASKATCISIGKISNCVCLKRVKSGGGYMWIKDEGIILNKIDPYISLANSQESIEKAKITKSKKFPI